MAWLVSDEAVWQYRAQVAREAADELGDLGAVLRSTLGANYLGVNCEEGKSLYAVLSRAVSDLAQRLAGEANQLHVMSADCRAAAESFQNSDELPGFTESEQVVR